MRSINTWFCSDKLIAWTGTLAFALFGTILIEPSIVYAGCDDTLSNTTHSGYYYYPGDICIENLTLTGSAEIEADGTITINGGGIDCDTEHGDSGTTTGESGEAGDSGYHLTLTATNVVIGASVSLVGRDGGYGYPGGLTNYDGGHGADGGNGGSLTVNILGGELSGAGGVLLAGGHGGSGGAGDWQGGELAAGGSGGNAGAGGNGGYFVVNDSGTSIVLECDVNINGGHSGNGADAFGGNPGGNGGNGNNGGEAGLLLVLANEALTITAGFSIAADGGSGGNGGHGGDGYSGVIHKESGCNSPQDAGDGGFPGDGGNGGLMVVGAATGFEQDMSLLALSFNGGRGGHGGTGGNGTTSGPFEKCGCAYSAGGAAQNGGSGGGGGACQVQGIDQLTLDLAFSFNAVGGEGGNGGHGGASGSPPCDCEANPSSNPGGDGGSGGGSGFLGLFYSSIVNGSSICAADLDGGNGGDGGHGGFGSCCNNSIYAVAGEGGSGGGGGPAGEINPQPIGCSLPNDGDNGDGGMCCLGNDCD